MIYNIITPMARFDNYRNIKSMLQTHISDKTDIRWHIITDDDCEIKISSKNDWIRSYVCPNQGQEFWKRCNYSINWFIDSIELNNNERYLFLNDDDSLEDNFFVKLNDIDRINEVIICSMKRGDNTPVNATGFRAHPTSTLIAEKKNMVSCSVGIEQIIISGKLLKNYRLPLHVWGDGMFIQKVTEENKTYYAKDIYSLFNFFEAGRWS